MLGDNFFYIFIQIDKFFPMEEDNEFVCFLMYLEKHWSWEAGCLGKDQQEVTPV